ncbi:MAG: hypothetical protein WCW26_04645 [Candidatus Buchananbacteria bacterium]
MPQPILQFVSQLLLTVLIQCLAIFGIFFILGFILCQLAKQTQLNYYRSVGWKGILWTGWLGTPIHEFSHLFFALVFFHRIDKVEIFKPNQQTGQLGEVAHSYNKNSFYQNLGNFFIGAGPMISGCIILVVLLYYLFPNGSEIYNSLINNQATVVNIFKSALAIVIEIFKTQNFNYLNFWLFLYVSFCIASHLAPSWPDLKLMLRGFALIVTILIFINYFALVLNLNFTDYILGLSNNLNLLVAIFTYAIVISFAHYLISAAILIPIAKLKK